MHEAGIEKFTGVKGKENNDFRLIEKIKGECEVYEINKDGVLRDIFKGEKFRDSWDDIDKATVFCNEHEKVFPKDGYSTFLRVGEKVIVVTRSRDGSFSTREFPFSYDCRWVNSGKNKRRIIVPLGDNLEKQIVLLD